MGYGSSMFANVLRRRRRSRLLSGTLDRESDPQRDEREDDHEHENVGRSSPALSNRRSTARPPRLARTSPVGGRHDSITPSSMAHTGVDPGGDPTDTNRIDTVRQNRRNPLGETTPWRQASVEVRTTAAACLKRAIIPRQARPAEEIRPLPHLQPPEEPTGRLEQTTYEFRLRFRAPF